jgi:putative nucleotidyltransferase with HDIG domain
MMLTLEFLTALGQAFAALALYSEEHPMRQQAIARVLSALHRRLESDGSLRISFIDTEVIVDNRPLTELRGWEWTSRLSGAGVQRIEIGAQPLPSGADMAAMLTEIRARFASSDDAFRPWSRGGIRFGPLVVATGSSVDRVVVNSVIDALEFSGLSDEVAAVGYIHDEMAAGHPLPMAEVEAIVHGLALTIRREQDVVLPLLDLRTFDEYTTTHSCNVSMLSIGLSEALGLSDSDAREIGTAALLHDIGKVRIPQEVLTKPGKLSDDERRLIESHPVEGARMLSERGPGNGLAATVAYEHHIWYNGKGGYPYFRFPRTVHFASRIVHVCDIYDALCSKRPYRAAWDSARALALIESIAGVELDPGIVSVFVAMVRGATELRHTIADAA